MTVINDSGIYRIAVHRDSLNPGKSKIEIALRTHVHGTNNKIVFSGDQLILPSLKAQLAQLGIKDINLKQIDKNDNGKIDVEELVLLDDLLEKNQETVLALGRVNDNAYRLMDVSFRKNKKFFLEVVQQDGTALMYADESLKKDPEIALAAIKQNYAAMASVDYSLRVNAVFQRKAWEISFQIYQYFSDPIDPEITFEYQDLLRRLKELNITDTTRFDLTPTEIRELISNRDPHKTDSRPIALIVYARFDEKKVLHKNDLRNLMLNGFRVVYVEAYLKDDLRQAYRLYGSIKKLAIFTTGGHGSGEVIVLGDYLPGRSSKKYARYFLRFSDFFGPDFQDLSRYLADDAVVVAESCRAGKGGQNAKNVANGFKKVAPQATIYSSRVPFLFAKYVFNQYGTLDVKFIDKDLRELKPEDTYIINTRRRLPKLAIAEKQAAQAVPK